MANNELLKASICNVIKANYNEEITGDIMQQTLLAMVAALSVGYQFVGIATPSTNPGTPDQKVFYIASESGEYPHFNNIEVGDNEIAIMTYDSQWQGIKVEIGSGLVDGAVTTAKIADNAVSAEKLAAAVRDKIDVAMERTIALTYAELKALRDAKKLIAGQTYRITDFVTTTTQTDTRSAGHAFDVIVIADDEDTLNENALACLHEGDTYFADCKLSAWELKYCLDNDTDRFAWADVTNGKGVIWWMKDEWNNECFYDFKNIQYKRWKVTRATDTKYQTNIDSFIFTDYQPYFYGIKDANNGNIYPEHAVIDETAFDWFYTFTARVNAEFSDASLKEHLTEEEKTQIQEFETDNKSVVSDCVIGKNTREYYMGDYYSSDTMFLSNAVIYNEIKIVLDDAEHIDNIIGGYAYSIRCGNDCSSWTCGNEVSGKAVLQDYVSRFHLDSGVSYITIKSSGTTSSRAPLQNFKVKAGVKGTKRNKLAIVIDAASFPPNSNYEWTIAKNSNGEIKQYCEADSIN